MSLLWVQLLQTWSNSELESTALEAALQRLSTGPSWDWYLNLATSILKKDNRLVYYSVIAAFCLWLWNCNKFYRPLNYTSLFLCMWTVMASRWCGCTPKNNTATTDSDWTKNMVTLIFPLTQVHIFKDHLLPYFSHKPQRKTFRKYADIATDGSLRSSCLCWPLSWYSELILTYWG